MCETTNKKDLSHHSQEKLCTTRPVYRQGRKLTAVKVYTVAGESQHLFIYRVPKINLRSELKSQCLKYGAVTSIHVVENDNILETEAFTECYHVHYQRIQSARIAKKFLDNKSFYGGLLHVCYAPEYESVQELKYKLEQRRYDVLKRLCSEGDTSLSKPRKEMGNSKININRKRKRPAIEITEERMAEVDPMIAWKDIPKELDPRQKANDVKDSLPKKYYQAEATETPPEVQKVKVFIGSKRGQVYGPQLPTNINDNTEEDKISVGFIPSQVLTSMEYKYNQDNTNRDTTKKIVFRDKTITKL